MTTPTDCLLFPPISLLFAFFPIFFLILYNSNWPQRAVCIGETVVETSNFDSRWTWKSNRNDVTRREVPRFRCNKINWTRYRLRLPAVTVRAYGAHRSINAAANGRRTIFSSTNDSTISGQLLCAVALLELRLSFDVCILLRYYYTRVEDRYVYSNDLFARCEGDCVRLLE